MNNKVKIVLTVLVVVGLISGLSVISYKRGLAKGYAAMDAMSKLQESANKHARRAGFLEGQQAGLKLGENATAADFCGYVGMLSKAADKRADFYKGLNEKYVYNVKDRQADNELVDRMADYIHAAYREECKNFSGVQIDGFIKSQEK
ncbi:hypothetical protein FMJ22_13425 [Klebsiella michiganensis]|uniref:hypothetical protein n=1 Tax=Klebsiella michiganensis TaxID=1134687 RepID=UPI001CCDB654|nr:hypothetical protein [Klebsiella michiganensis]MBZ7392396.1 hypothetical protein [Klebsiella michiganensis]